MEILNTIQTIAILVFLLLIIWWIYAKRKNKSMPISGKSLLIALAASLLVSMASGAAYNSLSHSSTNTKNDVASTNKTASNSTESSSSSSSSSAESEKTTENDVLQSLSSKELKKYNAGLIDSLSEEQQYANDGKESYNAALYIDNLKYDANRGLLVYVSDEFTSLSKDDKSTVANHAQKMANTQIVILGKEVQSESLPITNVYWGNKKLGRTTAMSGYSEFKWYK